MVYLKSSASFICHCSFYFLRYSTILSLLPFLSFSFNAPFCFITNKWKQYLHEKSFIRCSDIFSFKDWCYPSALLCCFLLLLRCSSLPFHTISFTLNYYYYYMIFPININLIFFSSFLIHFSLVFHSFLWLFDSFLSNISL